MPIMSRRSLVGSLAWGGAAGLWQIRSWALPYGGDRIMFKAYRNGSEIGWHRLTFSADADRLLVNIEIRFDVTFAFLTLYRYRHRNRETWQGARLVALDTTTDDDGERFAVRAEAKGEELVVENAAGDVVLLPADTLPSSYWHERTVEREQWLDTQSGRLARSTVERLGAEPIEAAGRTVTATRYRLRGDIDCELWYHERRWSKLRFSASDGSIIEYALEAATGDGAAWLAPAGSTARAPS